MPTKYEKNKWLRRKVKEKLTFAAIQSDINLAVLSNDFKLISHAFLWSVYENGFQMQYQIALRRVKIELN